MLAQARVHVEEEDALPLELLLELVIHDLGLVLGVHAGEVLLLRLGDAEPVPRLLDVRGQILPGVRLLLGRLDVVVEFSKSMPERSAPQFGIGRARKYSSALRRGGCKPLRSSRRSSSAAMLTRSSWHERCWRIPSTPSTYSDIYGLRQEQTELLLATAGALWGAPGDRRRVQRRAASGSRARWGWTASGTYSLCTTSQTFLLDRCSASQTGSPSRGR